MDTTRDMSQGKAHVMMLDQSVIRMANDIAKNVVIFSDPGEMFAEHINKFWAAALKRKLFEAIQHDPTQFQPLVLSSSHMIKCEVHNPIDPIIKDHSGTGG